MQDRAHQLANRAEARRQKDADESQPKPEPLAAVERDPVPADNTLSGPQVETCREGR